MVAGCRSAFRLWWSCCVDPRSPTIGPPRLEPLAPSAAVEALCRNNLDLARDPEAALDAYGWLATTATVVELHYSSAAEAASLLRDELARLADAADAPDRRAADRAERDEPADLADPTPSDGHPAWRVHVEPGDEPVSDEPGAPLRSGDVITLIVAGEVVLYRRATRTVVRLNHEGARRWIGVDDGDPGDAGETRAEPSTDVDGFWSELAEHGFVEPPTPADR